MSVWEQKGVEEHGRAPEGESWRWPDSLTARQPDSLEAVTMGKDQAAMKELCWGRGHREWLKGSCGCTGSEGLIVCCLDMLLQQVAGQVENLPPAGIVCTNSGP